VCQTAGDDEEAEADEHPIKRKIASSADELNKREWNSEVSGGDQKIRDEMKPNQAWIPEVTMPVRHEAIGAEEGKKKMHAQISARL